jgi:DNA-binding SARP family transcriptional activator
MESKVTYRQQYTRCGKQRCRKCREGAGHGPYWYAYWSENGRTVSKYIGAQLPAEVEQAGQRLSAVSVSARRVPAAAGSRTIVIGGRERRSGRGETRPLLRVYVLGQFRVERRSGNGWVEDDGRRWQRRRARALLGCLLCHPLRRMGREQVMEALWPDPDLDSETAANRLNGAVHELRLLLEPEIRRPASSTLLRLQHEVLELADGSIIWVDADEFEQKIRQAEQSADPLQIERLLEEAAALYRGDFLVEELYSEWAQPRREALRRRWMGMLLQLAELRVRRGALASAIEPLDRLLMSDPTHETAVRHLMMVLMRLDRRVEALQAYQRLTEVLEREYDSEPLPETRRLYEALRSGELGPATVAVASPALTGPGAASSSSHSPAAFTLQAGAHFDTAQPPVLTRSVGPTAPVRAVTNPHFPSGRHKRTPLIGRERELAIMRQLLSILGPACPSESSGGEDSLVPKPVDGQQIPPPEPSLSSPHFLLLTGEAGIGKTRLAEELSDEAGRQGWQVVWSRSYEQEGAIPYCPWVELLRTLLQNRLAAQALSTSQVLMELGLSTSHLQRLCTLLPEFHELLQPGVAPLALPVDQERLHLWEATHSLLSALSRRTPLLLVLDDLHWADESSLELLSYLARHLREQPILLLGTCRDMELLPTHTLRTLINDLQREQVLLRLPVQPLTAAQIAQLVSHLPTRLVHSIQTQADGNPFFAEELARYLEREASEGGAASAGQAAAGAGEGRLALPATIAAVLDRRLSKLSTACQTLLSKAAVFGAPFEFSHLLFMDSGQLPHPQEEQVLDLLEEALRAGLLIEEENGRQVSYHFWHPLIESHLYQSLSVARRVQLHRRAAEALLTLNPQREEEVAAAVTYHLIRGASDGSRIARYAERAANRAYRLAAYGEAQYYYRLALLALAGAPPPPPLERQAVVSVEYLPPEADADPVPSLDQLLPSAGEEELLHFARLLEHVCECCMMQGNYSEARRLYARVLALRQRSLQTWERRQPERPDGEQLHRQRQHEAQIQAIIWREMSLAWLRTGDFAQARHCLEEGKRTLREADALQSPASACLLLQEGNLSALEGNYDEARRQVEQMLDMLEEAMRQGPAPVAAGQELPTLSERAIAGDPLELGHAHETLGVIAARLGHPSEALQHLHTALTIYEQHECLMAMAQICGNLGAAHALVADHQAARAYMRRALELTERTGDLPNMAFVTGNLGELARRCGDLREAEACFRRSLALAERTQEREHLAWCNIALAETLQSAGKLDEALRCIQRSLLTGRAIGHARTIAHARIVLAEVRLAQASAICLACLRQRQPSTADSRPEQHGCRESCFYRRLLLRGQRALERALCYEGLDAEVALEGRYLQASVAFLLDRLAVARRVALDLLTSADRQENRLTLGHAHRLLARLLAVQGEAEAAAAHFERAARIFEESELTLDYARTLHSYGVHLALLGARQCGGEQQAKAHSYLREAQTLFGRAQAAIDLQWAETLLATWPSLPLLAAALKAMP